MWVIAVYLVCVKVFEEGINGILKHFLLINQRSIGNHQVSFLCWLSLQLNEVFQES